MCLQRDRADQLNFGPFHQVRPFYRRLDRVAIAWAALQTQEMAATKLEYVCAPLEAKIWTDFRLYMEGRFHSWQINGLTVRLRRQFNMENRRARFAKAIAQQPKLAQLLKDRLPERLRLYPALRPTKGD